VEFEPSTYSKSRDPKLWGYAEVVAGEEDAILRADRGDPDDIANVRLAAAAPDLLEALEDAVESLDFSFRELNVQADVPQCEMEELGRRLSRGRIAIAKARIAIAKARGKNHD
jgi:hypothetical protein